MSTNNQNACVKQEFQNSIAQKPPLLVNPNQCLWSMSTNNQYACVDQEFRHWLAPSPHHCLTPINVCEVCVPITNILVLGIPLGLQTTRYRIWLWYIKFYMFKRSCPSYIATHYTYMDKTLWTYSSYENYCIIMYALSVLYNVIKRPTMIQIGLDEQK